MRTQTVSADMQIRYLRKSRRNNICDDEVEIPGFHIFENNSESVDVYEDKTTNTSVPIYNYQGIKMGSQASVQGQVQRR